MASTSLLWSPIQSDPFSRTQIIKSNSNRKTRISVRAAKHESHDHDCFSGRLVDESLIVLRKRIHETKMTERNYESPKEWMEWEKQLYTSYDSMICDATGHLQSYLMEARPSLALGMIALIALSVPISTAVVMYNLLELIKGVLAYRIRMECLD